MLIGRDALCKLIPHDGSMCLLDSVVSWDENRIVCQSASHRRMDNPLRSDEGLSALAGIEYGAQAMAVHGGLLAREKGETIMPGYLAALRDIELKQQWLDGIEGVITVTAEKLLGGQGRLMYAFTLSEDQRILLRGRVTVMPQQQERQ